ncbi:pseudouridine synthase [Cardinium endosymbiont of Culicoides punctatus]|uniref:pseudouridine synthase n=1 Tax=Cardinium endosymbiont of Culicoides punctatus TaxID=2304601 RepID=UPI0010CEBD20|nr:pseudouridine synthase [Cardinium endosymbiont of Culicoides punctatus]TDG95735.1 Ribosomal large subunit pseudouridine synthase B [Cardinium endosymbiont of Culicoides punctatus]
MQKHFVKNASISLIRLNKFISNAGVCSRREADKLIVAGHITVNGKVMSTTGSKIPVNAIVLYKGVRLSAERFRYVLLNKPKGYVTTFKDPEGRKTVLDLIGKKYCHERVYPVGRLDYNTTGLLLLTNDGLLAQRLSHPTSGITKLYHVVLNKAISTEHFKNIQDGLLLEDGIAQVDNLAIVDQDPCQIGISIHMGKNRIIRRIFEHLGYGVNKLDRVGYAHLTKKNIARGQWIFLKDQDILRLKSIVKNVPV